MTAIAIDGGNARQNRRNAQASADAGALAGATALNSGATVPANCTSGDVRCIAAYYTFQSAGATVGSTMPTLLSCLTTPGTNQTCSRYVLGSGNSQKAVEVTSPYSYAGAVCAATDPNPCKQYVHVYTTWNSPNAFGRVAHLSLFGVSGSATAQNTGIGGPSGGAPPPVTDCSGEDNFSDSNGNPTLIQSNPVKAGTNIGAHFHAHENTSNLDPNSIVFKGPLLNADGTVTPDAIIPYNNDGTHGYKLSKIPPSNGSGGFAPYTGNQGQDVDIQYKIPNAPPLAKYQTDGVTRITYKASLFAKDTDQDHGVNAPDCGQANWSFTWDGQGNTGSCGENSFFGGNPPYFPSNGTATPSSSGNPSYVYANYVDESPIQAHNSPYLDSSGTDVGIKFTIGGPGFSVDDGTGTLVPMQIMPATTPGNPTTGYVLINSSPNYTTKIEWQLPDKSDPRWVNGATYTIGLKAYDTDNNKPGNDCGVASWSFTLTGASNGKIHLIE